jgi:hypothetical protein
MAYGLRDSLERGDLAGFGQWLHAGWEQKKRFATGVSNAEIDEAYALARANGALGGKIAGAGGGGFMMIYCQPGSQAAVTQALGQRGLRRMDFRFEEGGARVLLNAGLRLPALTTDDGRRTTDDPRGEPGAGRPLEPTNDEGRKTKDEIPPRTENPANGSRITHHDASRKSSSSQEDA